MSASTTTLDLFTNVRRNRRHLTIMLLGFSSGLPAALTASTLQAWFTEAGLNLKTIGAITLLVLPYSLRFLWAPFLDYFQIPGFDRRRGWLFVTQIALFFAIFAMALSSPLNTLQIGHWQIPNLMVIGFFTAFLSTSQDIVINAYQTEVLPAEERGLGAAIMVTGWRIGAIVSGALALLLASQVGWEYTYIFMASLMAVGLFATCIAPQAPQLENNKQSLMAALVLPFIEFFQRVGLRQALLILAFITTYKLGDALALALNTTFLLRGVGFSLAVIGLINKTVSITASLLGGIVAGVIMTRLSLYRALLIFGWIQGLANLGYALLAYVGKSYFLLVLTAFLENFCSGLGTIALFALLMALCNVRYTATQFAIFVALAFIARTIVGPLAAGMVEMLGWYNFFIACFIVSLPTLIFLFFAKNYILQLKK